MNLIPLAAREASFWMPPAATKEALGIDRTFTIIEWISYLYGFPIFAIVLLFVFLYRRHAGRQDPDPTAHHSFLLEVTWTVIPSIMVVGIFFEGFVKYVGMTTMPEDPYEIQVQAKKWAWDFTYPNGFTTNDLHIPAGRPILLTMRSIDVMHSLYIPAFRVKRDVIPGRYTQMWFNALPPENAGPEGDRYELFCTEYCGAAEGSGDNVGGHFAMGSNWRVDPKTGIAGPQGHWVYVHDAGQFDAWLDEASNIGPTLPPHEYGEMLYTARGCATCHSLDGKKMTGPTWKGLWQETRVDSSGVPAPADGNYIRESILYPQKYIVPGYKGVMPSYQGQLKDMELTGIVEFIKSISVDDYEPLPSPEEVAAAAAEAEGTEPATE